MVRGNPIRYIPQVVFYDHAKPSHPPFVKAILSEQMLYQSTIKPGKRDNIKWITLRPEDKVDDPGMPGSESTYSTYRPPVLILNSDIRWKSTYAKGDWTYQPSPQEQDWRNFQLLAYKSSLFDLEEIDNPSQEDLDEIDTLNMLIDEIGEGGEGYLETAYDLLNSGATGITWGLQAANIPVTVTSTFLSQKNRGQSFRLKRLEQPEGQARFEFTIEIGNGNSLYALVIGEDGNSSDFIHYRNMTPGKRKGLIKQLEAIKDNGRLTVEDRANILIKEDTIKKIQYDAKQAGRKQGELTAEENAQVDKLKKEIDAIKDGKQGLSEADEKAKAKLENDLYIEREQFSLQEKSKEMVGKTIDFSFHFLRAGYVIIQSGDGRKIYENKRLTGGVPEGAEPQFGDGLPAKAYITIKSDGGQWSLVYGNPKHDNRGTIWTNEFDIPFAFNMGSVQWLLEADFANPGCRIEHSLYQVRPPRLSNGIVVPGRYQIQIDMYSDDGVEEKFRGRYTPELYYIEMHIPAGPLGATTPVWSSQDPENMYGAYNKNRIMDLTIQDDRDRSRMCTAHIANQKGGANLPMLLGGKACDIKLYDTYENQLVNVMTHGFVGSVDRGDTSLMTGVGSGQIRIRAAAGSHAPIEILGCENFLDKEIENPITGNSKYLGDYLREMAIDAGLPPALYATLPVGDEGGCPKIKRMKPGCFPDVRPAKGTRFWEYFLYVVGQHGPRWEVYTDETGIRLTKYTDRLRTDLAYTTTGDVFSPQRLRRASVEAGGLRMIQDLRDYFTSATFIGDINPLDGMNFTETEIIPQATDERFNTSMFYTGVENHYTASVDRSLKSKADCLGAAREHLNITPVTPDGLAPWTLKWKADYNTTVKGGDIIPVNGVKYMIVGTEFASLNSGGSEGQQMMTIGQLAEDREVVF